MTRPDVILLLAAARTDRDARLILADAIQDADGETPAVVAARRMACEICDCPDTEQLMCWDRLGYWHWFWDVLGQEHDHIITVFGWDHMTLRPENSNGMVRVVPRHEHGTLSLYRFGRWRLVCPYHKRTLIAQKAGQTRRANRAARTAGGPDLFAGVDPDAHP